MAMKRGTKRLSIDLAGTTYENLDEFINKLTFTKPDVITKGYVINYVTNALISLDDEVTKDLYEYCKEKEIYHRKRAGEFNGFEEVKEENTAKQYAMLATMYNRFGFNELEPDKGVPMRRIDMRDGAYVIFPNDWIVLNEENANMCNYAYVIEIRDIYNEYNAPHFLVLLRDNIDMVSEESIYREAIEVYPDFKKYMDMQIEPVYDKPNEKGIRKMLNEEAWFHAPLIGLFKIVDYGNNRFQRYPFNAMVIRK